MFFDIAAKFDPDFAALKDLRKSLRETTIRRLKIFGRPLSRFQNQGGGTNSLPSKQ